MTTPNFNCMLESALCSSGAFGGEMNTNKVLFNHYNDENT